MNLSCVIRRLSGDDRYERFIEQSEAMSMSPGLFAFEVLMTQLMNGCQPRNQLKFVLFQQRVPIACETLRPVVGLETMLSSLMPTSITL